MTAPRLLRDPLLWTAAALTLAARAVVLVLMPPAWHSSPYVRHIVVDVWGWLEFWKQTARGLVPYVHVTKEYPVGAGLVYWGLGAFIDPETTPVEILRIHGTLMALCDAASAALLFALLAPAGRRRALAFALAFALTPTAVVLSPVRFESVVVLIALSGYALHRAGRKVAAAAVWAAGAWVKWFPAFFVAAQELPGLRAGRHRPWLRAAAAFLLVSVALNGPFLLYGWLEDGSADAWLATYRFHLRRHLYWDTVLGVAQLWTGAIPWERHAAHLSGGLLLLAVFMGARRGIAVTAVLVGAATLVVNRVYSPQFHLWFAPFVLLLAAEAGARRARALLALFALVEVLNVVVYPLAFTRALLELGDFAVLAARERGGPWTIAFSVAVLARSAALAALAAVAARGGRDMVAGP